MKKITALLLAAVMALSMAACGTKDSGNVKEAVIGGAEDNEATEDGGAGDASGRGGDEGPAIADRPQPIVMHIYGSEYLDQEAGDYTLLASYNVSGVILSDESSKRYPKLAKTLDDRWKEQKSAEKDWLSENKEYAREQYGYQDDYFSNYEDESDAYISRCDDRVLGVRTYAYGYLGGAHGYYGTYGTTYEVESGKELALSDVVTDLSVIKNTVKEKLSEGYPELLEEMGSFNAWDTIDDMFSDNPEYDPVWVMTSSGIEFYFNPYTLASYAAGAQEVSVSYSEIKDIMEEKYLPDPDMAYISSLSWGGETANLIDLNDDGVLEYLTIHAEYDYENEMYDDVRLLVNGNERKLDELTDMFDLDLKLVTFPSGTILAVVSGHTYNDYIVRTICAITGDSIKECGTTSLSMQGASTGRDSNEYGEYVAVDPAVLPMAKHLDILSTYGGRKTYRLTEEGQFESDDAYYMIPNEDGFFTLSVKQDFTADIIEEDGTVIEEGALIAHGTDLALYRTDGNDKEGETAIVDARLHDGRIVRMEVTVNYPHTVDGIEEFELFDNLMYAG